MPKLDGEHDQVLAEVRQSQIPHEDSCAKLSLYQMSHCQCFVMTELELVLL